MEVFGPCSGRKESWPPHPRPAVSVKAAGTFDTHRTKCLPRHRSLPTVPELGVRGPGFRQVAIRFGERRAAW